MDYEVHVQRHDVAHTTLTIRGVSSPESALAVAHEQLTDAEQFSWDEDDTVFEIFMVRRLKTRDD